MIKTHILSEKLDEANNIARYIKHVESEIYLVDEEIFKIFHDYSDDLGGYISNKKRKLIYLLEQAKKIHGLILPTSLLEDINNQFMGYTMPYFSQSKTLEHLPNEDLSTIVKILKQVSQTLQKLHQENIIVVDFNFNNILYNLEESVFCDVDSMVIDNHPSEVIPLLLFLNRSIEMPETPAEFYQDNTFYSKHTDVFELNYLILSLLYRPDIVNLDRKEYQEYIKSLHFPSKVQKALLTLQNVFYQNEELIYPDQYLDELADFLVKKRQLKKDIIHLKK